jgi:phage terminase large subunit
VISEAVMPTVLKHTQNDPLWFVENVLGVTLWEKQREILADLWTHRSVNVQSCNGSGKSYLAAAAVLSYLYIYPGSTIITTAPTQRQIEEILWREIGKMWASAKVALGGTLLNTSLNIEQSWFAIGVASDKPDSYQGFHNSRMLIVMDEACAVPETTWQALEGCMSSPHARRLAIGNPTDSTTRFYRECNRRSPSVKNHIVNAFDTPNVKAKKNLIPGLATVEWIDEVRQRYGENSPYWNARVLGQFDATGENALLSRDDVEAAFTRFGNAPTDGPRVLGCDVARFGTDESALYLRTGQQVQRVLCKQGLDTMALTGEISNAIKKHRPTAVNVDVVGVGAGVVDRLSELQGESGDTHFVNGVNVGAASSDPEKYVNLRAEAFWNLRGIFRDGVIALDPEDDELKEQLLSLRYQYDSRGRLQIEKKSDAKKRGVESPDRADAVMLAMFVDPITDYNAFTRSQ